jgi:radical SAM superfamily enzyme YgiQ (UPF0313 family)
VSRVSKVFLIIPQGVHDLIYPWGTENLKDFLNHSRSAEEIVTWNLNRDVDLLHLLKRYWPLVGDLRFVLRRMEKDSFVLDMMDKFIPQGTSHLAFNILCAVGAGLFDFKSDAITNTLLKAKARKCADELSQMKREFEALIKRKFEFASQGAEKVLIGVSVYDQTILSSLYISKLIKDCRLDASIIFGGDYFKNDLAREVVNKIGWVDGVVVGYGEEVMKEILSRYEAGFDLKEERISGFFNSAFLKDDRSKDNRFDPWIPGFYKEGGPLPVSYVKDESHYGTLRIMAQRGCGYGLCTFCAILDKDKTFAINLGEVKNDIKRILTEKAVSGKNGFPTYWIWLDSDTNVPKNVMPIIDELKTLEDPEHGYIVYFWMRVSACSREFIRYLRNLRLTRVRTYSELGIESLNPETLKNMAKGSDPLTIVERIKAVHDCGGVVGGNYFMSYPLENVRNVHEEVEVLRKSLHLICTPKTYITPNYYLATDRDPMNESQEKFKIMTQPIHSSWLKRLFGVDLPLSLFSNSYHLRLGRSWAENVTRFYFNSIYRFDVDNDRPIPKRAFPLERAFMALKRLVKWAYVGVNGLFCIATQLSIGDLSYWHRFRFLVYLVRTREAFFGHIRRREIKDFQELDCDRLGGMEVPKLFISGRTLTKKYPDLFRSKWSFDLAPIEMDLLRYLYWQRSRQNTHREMKTKYPEADEVAIESLIEKHMKLGSIMAYRNNLVSVANDPEYFETQSE